MSSTRPRRSIQPTNYKETKGSDSEDSDSTSCLSELADSDEDSQRVIYLPTPSEILQTEALILVQNEELSTIDAEYQALKRKIKVVEMRRNVALQRLLKTKSQLARIRTLPQEVLSYIFSFYMEHLSHSPWTLMQVTRAWRATALSIRTIWAKIMLTSPAWKKYGSSRWKDGREVCGGSEQLDRALRRAGNSPLDIMISLNSPLGNNFRQYDKKAIASMLELLASTRKCLQVHHLYVDGQCCPVTWPSDPTSLEFPGLQTLSVTSLHCYSFVAGLSASSNQLTEMHIPGPYTFSGNYEVYCAAIERLAKSPGMTSLTLNAARFYRHHNTASFESQYRVLSNARNITMLELSQLVGSHREDEVTPVVQLPYLHTLTLRKKSRAWSFDAPSLTSVTLADESFIPKGPPGSNEFPHLASLTIVAPLSWMHRVPIDLIHFPPLHTLDVCFGPRSNTLVQLMEHRHDLNPVVFRIRKVKTSTTQLIGWLESMERLEELELEDINIKKQLFEFLASRKVKSQVSTRLQCPLLVRLQVDLKSESSMHSRNMQKAARRAASARIKAGIPIEKWLVRSADER